VEVSSNIGVDKVIPNDTILSSFKILCNIHLGIRIIQEIKIQTVKTIKTSDNSLRNSIKIIFN